MANLIMGDRVWPRAELDDRARRLATILGELGVHEDDSIALLLRNDLEYFTCTEACRYRGARYVPINWHAAPPEISYILEDSGAKALIGHDDLIAAARPALNGATPVYSVGGSAARPFEAAIANAAPQAGAPKKNRGIFAYTSGSTGRPKGIRRIMDPNGPDGWMGFKGLSKALMGCNEGDRFYIAAPLYHSAPNALSHFVLAGEEADLVIGGKFDPEEFLSLVETLRLTHAYIVPTMMVRMLKLPEEARRKYDVSTLRYTVSTGSPCPPDVKRAMIDWFGPILWESYGASELGFMTMIGAEDALKKPGSVGKPIGGGSIRILNDQMEDVPVREQGAIYIRLPMFGDFQYTNQDGALANQRQDGHVTVGDVGYLDEEGFLFISDRKKDMIISGGVNIFPAEIEAALIEMPQIQDVAVFGAPDAEFGEKIVAAVQLRPGAELSLEDARAYLQGKIAAFKIPKVLDVHAELPREDSGKIFKARLRAPYWDAAGRKI